MRRISNELRDLVSFIKVKAVCCQSTSIDALWERTREKVLRTTRKPFVDRGEQDEVSALTAQNLDELDKLIAKKIATTSVLEEAHSTNQRTSKRAGRALCDFFVGLQGYCQAYSGVVQLMGGLDQSFVTGALQALGLFMVVAVNKSETETRIHSMIKTLTSEYARIRKIVGIYSNSSTLRECVATVYRLGIECLREATVYYSYGPWRRLWHVVSSPPEIDLDAKISDLRSAINELNEERDVEAHLRLNRVEDKVDDGLEQSNLERLDVRLEKIRSLLGLSPVNTSTLLRDFASSLENDFSHLRRIPPFRAEDLTSNTSFKDWLDAALVKSSTFLLIQGRTVAPHDSNVAWVSQATVEAVRRLQEKKAIFAWHLCKPEGIHESDYGDIHPVPTAAVVLASLGYRLLEMMPQGRASSAARYFALRAFDGLSTEARGWDSREGAGGWGT
ncbi:hypothetical protein CSAL01_08473 [Colletotrichum salicis]|uniref:DUF7708 domain-containing protein n=1 Tax=Colletotrichum salicis TaxID=1209931 RepID=A0A135UHK3_9PEZI|nr:hypothetical protein CSAL01_08473 [Colletotrichum salicis]